MEVIMIKFEEMPYERPDLDKVKQELQKLLRMQKAMKKQIKHLLNSTQNKDIFKH